MNAGKGPVRAVVLAVGAACVLTLAAAAAGCGDGSAEAREKEEPPELTIFVYDRSGSIADHQLARAQDLTGGRVLELGHGDRIVAMQVLEASRDEPGRRWSQIVPEREYPDVRADADSLARVRFLRDARDYMRSFTDTASRETVNATDLLSTMHDVAAELRAHENHRSTLYLFSDMLQANRRLNFEEPGRRPPLEWVERANSEATLPDLEGLCVVVTGGRVDTGAGQAVREFWQRYFEAAGAELQPDNYRYRFVRLPVHPCGRTAPAPAEASE
mgnify:CR=1 FL=1